MVIAGAHSHLQGFAEFEAHPQLQDGAQEDVQSGSGTHTRLSPARKLTLLTSLAKLEVRIVLVVGSGVIAG